MKKKSKNEGTESIIKNLILQTNNKIHLFENGLDNLREHVNLIESNAIEQSKSREQEIEVIKNTIKDLNDKVKEIRMSIQQITDKSKNFADKEQVNIVEKYIDIWNPIHFTTEQDVREIIKEEMKSKK